MKNSAVDKAVDSVNNQSQKKFCYDYGELELKYIVPRCR